ncbi:hypothetical protein J1779_02690 [Rahnella sp. FC061912-K]|uniref:hypothetical protein n=1 Tax=Rahnella rivi TaxID=2816249 RepID=UPI001C2545FA|nr:hypothetical protein [Rahnella rivi]MBU9828833.1 hypothetical protein [Rahnella rivi]
MHRDGKNTEGNLLSIDQQTVDALAMAVMKFTQVNDKQNLDGQLQEHEADEN